MYLAKEQYWGRRLMFELTYIIFIAYIIAFKGIRRHPDHVGAV